MPEGKFTKADIMDALYEKTELSRMEIKNAVDLLIDEMKGALLRRQIIELRGFGTFEVKMRKERSRARNPKTGEVIAIHSHGFISFHPGRELKQKVRKISDDDKS